MGLESYNILLLPENVSIIRENEYWKLCGASDISVNIIHEELDKLCSRKNQYPDYVLDGCIEIRVYEDKMLFQGLELRGCLSHLKGGAEECYQLYQLLNGKVPLDLFILNEKIEINNSNDLYDALCNMYSDKLKIFRKQYENIELKATCGDFYKEIKRRRRWYNKLLYHMKKKISGS